MRSKWQRIKSILYDSFLFILIYELFEEAIENLIAYLLSSALSDFLSKVLCVSITQGLKFAIKNGIKVLTYREGNDKMKLLKKILYSIYFNKCTIFMTLVSAFGGYCAYVIIPLEQWIRILIACSILTLGILCSMNIGWERYDEIKERLEKSKNKRIEKRNRKNVIKNEKRINKENKLKQKEINKIAEKIKKEKMIQFKEEEKQRQCDFENKILDEARIKYENDLVEVKNEAVIEQPQVDNNIVE